MGHAEKGLIFMPFDIRDFLGVEKGVSLRFSIRRVGWWGRLRWYVASPDPAVHLPARLTIIGLLLALVGLALSVRPLLY